MVGFPAYVSLHDIVVLMFHGTSLIDMNMSIPGLKNEIFSNHERINTRLAI